MALFRLLATVFYLILTMKRLFLTLVVTLSCLINIHAASIHFKDFPLTNNVKSTDLLLIDSALGGTNYATRTATKATTLGTTLMDLSTNTTTGTGPIVLLTALTNAPGVFSTLVSLTPTSPQSITFSVTNGITQWLVATGDVTVASASLSAAAAFTIHIDNQQATNINVIVPTGWRLVSGARTNILAPYTIGLLSGFSRAANDTNVVSLWASE